MVRNFIKIRQKKFGDNKMYSYKLCVYNNYNKFVGVKGFLGFAVLKHLNFSSHSFFSFDYNFIVGFYNLIYFFSFRNYVSFFNFLLRFFNCFIYYNLWFFNYSFLFGFFLSDFYLLRLKHKRYLSLYLRFL